MVGVWLFNYFTAKLETVTNEVTRSAQDLIDWCHKQVNPHLIKDAANSSIILHTPLWLALISRSESDFIVLITNNKKGVFIMGMNMGGKKGGAMEDINVTPLVDVVLCAYYFHGCYANAVEWYDETSKIENSRVAQDVGQHLVVESNMGS